jgi:cold-inducible RNA-binding protein
MRRSHTISTKVFVGNLNFRTSQEQLTQLFSSAGEIRSVYLPSDRETGRPRGFAFVEFASEEQAAQAIRQFDGQEVDGRKLRVNAAEERAPRFGAGGRPRPGNGSPTGWSAPAGGDFLHRDEPRNFKTKGSRRNLRARKRSLNY